MAYSSEIDKLRARYNENPKGRNFAPLADAYRKAGQLDEAINLCRQGLALHPDYVSAHIVLGRCFVDSNMDPDAEASFRHVLTLDPENIIALKSLAELATRNDQPGQAVEWLTRLLQADPMNGDAAEALALAKSKVTTQAIPPVAAAAADDQVMVEHEELTLGERAAGAAPLESLVEAPPDLPSDAAAGNALDLERASDSGMPRVSAAEGGIAEAPTAMMAQPDFPLERTSHAPEPPPTPAEAVAPAPIESYDGTVDASAAAAAASLDGLMIEEPEVTPEPDAGAVEGLARTQYEGSGMFRVDLNEEEAPAAAAPAAEPAAPPVDDETSPPIDLPLITPEDAEAEAQRRKTPMPAALRPPAIPAAPPVLLPDDDGAVDRAALAAAEPVVTETMAELYERQGHVEDALRVYRALLAERPGDARLAASIAKLEGRPAPEPEPVAAVAPPAPVAPPPPPPAPPPPEPAVAAGPRAGEFLRSIFRSQAAPGALPPPLPSTPDGPATLLEEAFDAQAAEDDAATLVGQPTQPAKDALSLDRVFGDAGRDSVALGAVEGPASTEEPPRGSGGFSFDDFFGAPGARPKAPEAGAPAPAARPSGRSRNNEPEEDLDQFQAWLRGLKT